MTETVCDYEKISWHTHQDAYFSFATGGGFNEINRRETYVCPVGSLIFHNAEQPHYNVKPAGLSRCFQLELSADWFAKFEVDLNTLPANQKIEHPSVKLLFYNIYKESKRPDATSQLTVDALLLETFETLRGVKNQAAATQPRWVGRIDEILHDQFDQPLSLQELADALDLHAAHLSRDFPRYFRCNFSQYVRKKKSPKRSLCFANKISL